MTVKKRSGFLAAMGEDDAKIEASFCAAMKTARELKSISVARCTEAAYTEYRRRKVSVPRERGLRLPLWNPPLGS
jgi:hypothetical protein